MLEVDMKQAIGVATTATGTALSSTLNETLYTISLVLTILGTLWTFVVWPLIQWYKRSKADDGKIDSDELKEGIDIAKDGVEKTLDEINKKK